MAPEEPPLSDADARALRWLRGLVTVLTATMIVGIAAVVVLLWARLPVADPTLGLPDTLSLAPEATVVSVSRGDDWWAVATASGEILVYGTDGALRSQFSLPDDLVGVRAD